jgi:transcriptional regulator with XRE-family HTH domain
METQEKQPSTIENDLAKQLRIVMDTKHVTVEQLSHTTGFHRSFLYRVLKAEKQASLRSLESIARALEIPVRDLFPPA